MDTEGRLYLHRPKYTAMKPALPSLLLLTLSCLWAPPQLQAQAGSLVHDGLERTYLLRLPATYDGVTPLPLVIAMHGGFGSGGQLENQSQLTVKAEEEGFIVVYPDGVAAGLLNIRTWNAGWCCGQSVSNDVDDVGFINALLDTLIATHAIDTTRIHATGMSNGGFMSYRLACELAPRIASIAPVAASMAMPACAPTRAVPVIAIHSYLDENVPHLGGQGSGVSNHYNNAQDSVLNAWATYANCQVLNDTLLHDTQQTVVEWSACDCEAVMRLHITQDGGHSWHGGQGTAIGDPPSTTVSANDLMWDFFVDHPLACPVNTGLSAPESTDRVTLNPNPVTGHLHVEADAIDRVQLFGPDGRKTGEKDGNGRSMLTLDTGPMTPGAWLVVITLGDGSMHHQRVIKE
jgi:polyhydroxybutyrate depolymerase